MFDELVTGIFLFPVIIIITHLDLCGAAIIYGNLEIIIHFEPCGARNYLWEFRNNNTLGELFGAAIIYGNLE